MSSPEIRINLDFYEISVRSPTFDARNFFTPRPREGESETIVVPLSYETRAGFPILFYQKLEAAPSTIDRYQRVPHLFVRVFKFLRLKVSTDYCAEYAVKMEQSLRDSTLSNRDCTTYPPQLFCIRHSQKFVTVSFSAETRLSHQNSPWTTPLYFVENPYQAQKIIRKKRQRAL